MPVIKPRTRLVNFRLTDDEYDHLIAACSLRGARSLSDFARSAVLRLADPQTEAVGYLQCRLTTLDERVLELEDRIKRLIGLLHTSERAGSVVGT